MEQKINKKEEHRKNYTKLDANYPHSHQDDIPYLLDLENNYHSNNGHNRNI